MSLPASPNFRSRAESIDAMDILDELMTSFDDTLSASSPPQQHDGNQQHSLQNSPNHMNHNDHDDMTWRLTNSVHMVLQENARLPTFVENVDRTGSSFRKLHYLHEPQQQQDGSVNTNDYKAENLGEAFLGSSNRHAYHGSYANAGALTHGGFTTAATRTTTTNYNTIGQDVQGAAASPAASSNRDAAAASTSIRKDLINQPTRLRGDSMEQLFDYQMMDYVASIQDEKKDTTALYDNDEQLLDALSVDPTPLEEIKRTTMLQRHSGQHRQQALPIPVNGARDINFMRGSIVNDSGGMASPELSLQQHSDHAGRSGSFAATDAQRQASTNSAANHQASASKSIPASIERASQQKSQYGFGRKHKVPSIPEPLSHAPKATTGGGVKKPHKRTHDGDGDDPDDSGSNNVNAGDAYERKKHRAKVARVKLNESIEQLSIAIHVAGSQSKERADQWQTVVKPSSSFITSSVPACLTEATLTAEQAKKWDRPTFVRSAAKMVEYLNTQCDLLMRELVLTKNELKNGDNKRKADENGAVYTEEMEAKRCRVDQVLHHNQQGLAIPVIDITIRNGMDLILGSSSRVNSCIASFLDPATIVRCTQVSKTFKRHFDGSVAWNDMAIQRFGFFNVRQWHEKLEDADEGISCLPLRLYKCMDAENVMPHFNHDGMFLLGEARLQGVVSAWTFLVERSNGETLRSCKRSDGQDTFTSLPVVELRTVVQNTGRHDYPIIIREQLQSVDASTRRRGVEMKEISWDERFSKRIVNLDGSVHFSSSRPRPAVGNVICQLGLFESAVIQTHIHAQGCSTISKFVQRSNFTKFLIQIRDGTTVPLVIPFPRDHSHTLEH